MSTLQDFVDFTDMRKNINNDFLGGLVCMLERELLSNPIAFALKYDVSLQPDEIAALNSQAQIFVGKSPLPTCPSTSGHPNLIRKLVRPSKPQFKRTKK